MKALKAFRGITKKFKNKNLIFFPLCLELVLERAKINPFVEILANFNLKCFKLSFKFLVQNKTEDINW